MQSSYMDPCIVFATSVSDRREFGVKSDKIWRLEG